MQRLLRVLGACVLLAALAGIVVWFAWQPILDAVRRRAEPLLAAALHLPVRIGDARLTLQPFQLAIGDLDFGEGGTVLRVRNGYVTLDLRESMRRRQLVGDLEASDVDIAPLGFVRKRDEETPKPLPRFSVRRARIANLRVTIPAPDAPFEITASQVNGRVGVGDRGHLNVLAGARKVRVQRGDRNAALDVVRARLDVHGSDVIIRSARVNGADFAARVASKGALGHHVFHVATNVGALDVIDPALRQIDAHLEADGTITGPLQSPTVEAHVRAPHLTAHDQEVLDIDAQLHWHAKDLDLVTARARHVSGSYLASGKLSLDKPFPFDLKADWQHEIGTPPATGNAKLGVLKASATMLGKGTLTPLSISAEVNGKASRSADGTDTLTVSGRGDFTDGALRAEATATQQRGNTVEASLTMNRDGQLEGFARSRVAHVPSLQLLLGTPVTPQIQGALSADARVAGTRAQPRVDATLAGKDLNFFGASITTLDAAVRTDGEQLVLERLLIRLDRGSVAGGGKFGLRQKAGNDWQLNIADVPTQTIASLVAVTTGVAVPLWGGQVKLDAIGRGAWSDVGVQASLQIDNFYLQHEPVDRLVLKVESAWPQWTADGRIELGPQESLSLIASGKSSQALSLSLQSSRWDLTRIQKTNQLGLRGMVQLTATATGAPAALSGHLHLGGEAIEWSGRALGETILDAEGQAGKWKLSGKVGELLALNGSFDSRGDLPLEAALEWHDADLAPLLRPDQNARVDSSGSLRLQVPLRAAQRLSGTLQVDRLDVVSADQAAPLVSVETPILIVASGGRFDLRSVRLRGTGTALAANGWFNSAGECDIGVDATSDLALVEVLSPAIYAARGNAVVTARAQRRGGAPLQLMGTATLERVAFDLGQPWVAVNVNGHMTFHDSIVSIDTLSGRLAGGTFAIGGVVDVARGPQLTWTATEIAPAAVPDVEMELSGNGSVVGTWSELTVAGEVEVARALYDRRFAITDIIPLFQRQLAKPPAREAPRTVVRLNLHIVAPDELFVDNNVAKVEMSTNLWITGTADNVAIAGPIQVLNGEVKFRGRTFTLETGVVEFRPELGRQAYLNITAQTVVPTQRATYTVDTHIVGTTDKYQITFSSDDPGLSQTDLLSLVTFGKTVAELQQGGGGVSVNDLLALAPGLYQDQAQEQAQNLLGIDRVELEPGYSKSTGVYEPRITLGKNLTKDLTASVSSTFGLQRRQQVQLEYRVSPRISLLADWESASTNQAGAFAGEIKFHYPFRTFPGWTALLPWPGEDVQ